MKKILINDIIKLISKYYSYSEEKLEEIRYGLEAIYLTIFKTIFFMIISVVLNDTKEFIVFLLTFGLLKLNSFGVHAKKQIQCWIFSSIFFIGIPYIIKYFIFNKNIILILTIPLIILLAIYSPADTEKRPLINKKKRKKYKILTIIISMIYFILMIYTNNYIVINTLFMSMLLQSIIILPISYKVLGVKYSNYLNYKEKED